MKKRMKMSMQAALVMAATTQCALAQNQAAAASRGTGELKTMDVQAMRDTDTLHLATPSSTASRLGLTLKETPASVEVITQDVIQQRGARTLTEALRGAAGLSGGNPPSAPTTLSMRGFNNILFLYDGARTSGAGVINRVEDTWNYERIEVLKGPASVLNGDTAIGGIVNFITKRPDRHNPGSEVFLSYGSYGSTRVGVGTGGAIGESGAYRLDYSQNDSQVGAIARSGEHVQHLTTGLVFDLGSGTKLDLAFDYLKDNNDAYFGTPLVPASFSTEPTNVVSTPDGRVIDRRIAAQNYNVLNNANTSETYWLRAKLTGQLASNWSWRNELVLNKANRLFQNSESAVFAAPGNINRDQTLITHDQRYIVDRLDATHRGQLAGMDNRFVVGGEVSKTSFDSMRRFSDGTAATAAALRVTALNPNLGFWNDSAALSASGGGNRTDTTSDVKTSALFAEDALKLSKDFTLVAGLRHDRTDVQRGINDLNLGTRAAFGTQYSSTSARLGTVYDLSPNAAVYAQFTNATIPVSSLFLLSAANTAFPPSRGKQLEVGFKQSLPEARVEWTAAVYKIELDNVLSRDSNNTNLTVNNGQQSSQGIELSAAWRATRQLTLSGNVAALQAKFDNLIEAGGVSRVGNVPPNVPEQVLNLFANYRFADVPLELFAGVNHTGAMYTENANQIRINSHTTADVAASYRLKPALLTFRVRNLTDKLYATYGGRASSQVLLAPLRTFEVSAKVDF
jgi:iron complex outermembrane receptor protein